MPFLFSKTDSQKNKKSGSLSESTSVFVSGISLGVPHSSPSLHAPNVSCDVASPSQCNDFGAAVTPPRSEVQSPAPDAVMEGIAYDALLASTLNMALASVNASACPNTMTTTKILAAGYLTPPVGARAPPNSPVGTVRFKSRIGVGVARGK